MNIIWICPEMPYPANTGGRIGVFKRLEYFGKSNRIFFYCIVDSGKDFIYKSKLEEICEEVHLYNRNKSKISNIVKSLFEGPYACVSRTNRLLKNDINEKIDNCKIDFLFVDFPQMLGNIDLNVYNKIKVVLNQHNIEHKALYNISNSISNPIKKLVYRIEANKLRRWEENFYRLVSFSLITFVSIKDKDFFENKYNLNNTLLVPVGAEIYPYRSNPPVGHSIAYFGKMEYPANAEAAIHFATKAFVKIKAEIPDAKFYIVGKNPPKNLKSLANDSIIVTGTVDSVDPYYDMARLVVIPLSHGGGVKVKLLEGMGKGALLLSTSKGIEGTDFVPNEDVLVADSEHEIAIVAKEALMNPDKFENIRRSGYDKVNRMYSWSAVINNFTHALQRLNSVI